MFKNKEISTAMLEQYIIDAIESHGGGYDPNEHPLFGGLSCDAHTNINKTTSSVLITKFRRN